MSISLGYLGPSGTNTETAALAYQNWLQQNQQEQLTLLPHATIAQTLHLVALKQTQLAIVPVENSIQGSVAITLDTLWQLDQLHIQQELVLPIFNTLLSYSPCLENLNIVYSHPQALAQCQRWLEKNLPQAQLISTNSTTEALPHLAKQPTAAAIASPRAAKIYNLPVLATNINDYADNCTRFWVMSLEPTSTQKSTHISLAFSLPANLPGALVKPLEIFASRDINLTRIESRPTKRSFGEYIFYIDLQADFHQSAIETAFQELASYTEILKIFGHYNVLKIQDTSLVNWSLGSQENKS